MDDRLFGFRRDQRKGQTRYQRGRGWGLDHKGGESNFRQTSRRPWILQHVLVSCQRQISTTPPCAIAGRRSTQAFTLIRTIIPASTHPRRIKNTNSVTRAQPPCSGRARRVFSRFCGLLVDARSPSRPVHGLHPHAPRAARRSAPTNNLL
jgi:hypothetical protein